MRTPPRNARGKIGNQPEQHLGTKVDILTCRPEKLRPGFYERIKHDEAMLYAAQ